jgi:hypothetical protein
MAYTNFPRGTRFPCLPSGNWPRFPVFYAILLITFLPGLLLLMPVASWAQQSGFSTYGQAGGYVSSSDRTPFWMRSNQWGRVPISTPTASAIVGIHFDSRQTGTDSTQTPTAISWRVGTEVVANAGPVPQVLLPEAYAGLRWRFLELRAGRQREVFGIMDTTLTSGSYSWSGNALPVPKVQLIVQDYVSLPFLPFIALKGSFAHGWFNVPYIQRALLHQKSLSGRLGTAENRFHLYMGLNHHVVWGGEADYLVNNPLFVNGKLTRSFRDFVWGVLLGKSPRLTQTDRFTNFDGENRVGNHVGHFDFAADYRFSGGTLLLYHQHPFEDASGLLFQNLEDGLYGLSWKAANQPEYPPFFQLRGTVLEVLHTKDQTAPTFRIPNSRFLGNDNYFNHSQYREGWSYLSRSLGTPFILPWHEINEAVGSPRNYFPNNRVFVYHWAAEALIYNRIILRTRLSYSQNFGTNDYPYLQVPNQLSALAGFEVPVWNRGHTHLTGQLAYDHGSLLPKTLVGFLGLRSYGWGTRSTNIFHRQPF